MSEGGDEDVVRILRINDNTADLAGVREASIIPRMTTIDRLIDTVAGGEV
jgi:hypothetical protein